MDEKLKQVEQILKKYGQNNYYKDIIGNQAKKKKKNS